MRNKKKSDMPQAVTTDTLKQVGEQKGGQIVHQLATLAKRSQANRVAMTAALAEASMSDMDSALLPNQSNSFLRMAVIISVVFHLLLLTIKFTDPQAINDFFQRSSLEVVLLNVQGDQAPNNAQVLAQHNYAGGGESDDPRVYATTPQAYSDFESQGDSFESIQQQLNAARQESMRALAVVKEQFAQLAPIDPSWGENDPRRIAEEERRQELSNKIAAIEQRIQEENSRPRRMFIGPSARKDAQAMYYDSIRRKIEQKGTESFPQHAGVPLFGSLLMQVDVNAKGELVRHIVSQSSGNAILDRQAMAIVDSAGPFSAAPAELLRLESNVEFVFIMRFNFLNEGKVETELVQR